MQYKELYLRYKAEDPRKRRKLIKKMATEHNLSVREVVDGIMPFIIAEKPQNRFGKSIYIIGNLEDQEAYEEAEKRFMELGKRCSSLYKVKEYKPEDAYVLAMSNLRMCDTVYLLNGWADEPLAAKVRVQAMQDKKIMAYQEYEV